MKQSAAKGRGFHTQMCAREGMVFPEYVRESVLKVIFSLIRQNFWRYAPLYHLGTIFVGFCASKGMNFGQKSARKGRVRKFCANEGRGSAAPS